MSTEEELGNEIATLSAHLDAATQRLLACIRAFDEAGAWERQGAVSCAHWLSWRVGLDLATAREKVRVARVLGQLPLIDGALGRGEISYAKARAITRVGISANEQRLLELARTATGAQLERICRGYRQVAASLTDEGPLPEERSVRERILSGGMVKLELVLHPDEAALVRAALDKARDSLRGETRVATRSSEAGPPSKNDVSAETSGASIPAGGGSAPTAGLTTDGHRQVSLADAAVHMAQVILAGGKDGASSDGERHQLFVHLDQDVLGDDGSWVATLDDGARLPAETLRRVACDAGLVATTTDRSGTVLDVGRRTRTIPPAIRRALWVRDRGCRWPGCTNTRFLHGHHIQHWLHGGPTNMQNLVLLCTHHHGLIHGGGASIETNPDTDAIVFRAPRGTRLPAVPPPEVVEDAVTSLRAWAEERELDLGPDTALPWWDGSVPDYDWTISSLLDSPIS